MNASRISPVGVRLGGYVSIGESTPFKEGWCEIQDEGSQFMALFAIWPEIYGEYLQERPGDSLEATIPEPPRGRSLGYHVIDTCAGAGGKSLAMADFLEGRGRVFSYDISEVKLRALKKRAKRAQIQNIQTLQVQDGQEEMIGEKFRGSADRVLVDAPCTGWGVLRRNPDIKWRQSESELLRLPTLQRRILSGYSSLVRKGGFLTYGVCTFRRAETLDVVEHFLLRHSEFRLIKQGFLGPTSSDGFFMAAFQRDKE
jgi:16S rRNA (cytosine967-C5)-methyltransferase